MMPSCIPKSYSNRVLASLPAIEMRQIDAAFITGRFAERPYPPRTRTSRQYSVLPGGRDLLNCGRDGRWNDH